MASPGWEADHLYCRPERRADAFRLGVEGSLFRSLSQLAGGPVVNGWPPARESPKAMEPKPPVPVSSTRKHHRRTKSESQQFFFRSHSFSPLFRATTKQSLPFSSRTYCSQSVHSSVYGNRGVLGQRVSRPLRQFVLAKGWCFDVQSVQVCLDGFGMRLSGGERYGAIQKWQSGDGAEVTAHQPTRSRNASNRVDDRHYRLPPAAGWGTRDFWQDGALWQSMACRSQREYDHHFFRRCFRGRQAAPRRHVWFAHDPGQRTVDDHFFQEFNLVGQLQLRRKRRRAARERQARRRRDVRCVDLHV